MCAAGKGAARGGCLPSLRIQEKTTESLRGQTKKKKYEGSGLRSTCVKMWPPAPGGVGGQYMKWGEIWGCGGSSSSSVSVRGTSVCLGESF